MTESVTPVRRLGIAEVEERLGVHRNTITAWYKAGRFPKPHYLAELRRWWLHEIVAWEEAETRAERPRKRLARPTRSPVEGPALS